MLKLLAVLMALAALATPHRLPAASADDARTTSGPVDSGLKPQELRDADDMLWLLDRDRRTLSGDYQRMVKVLDASRVPNADRARDIALRFKLTHGGLLAEEGAKVVGLLRIGRDLPPFSSRGDLVWVVRISHWWLGVTQEMWIGSATGEVRTMLPVNVKE